MPVSSNLYIYGTEEMIATIETGKKHVWLRLCDEQNGSIVIFHFDEKGEAAVKKAQRIADAFNAMKEPKAAEEPGVLSTGME